MIDDVVAENEVLVRFTAAPINPADINQIQGVYPVKPSLPGIGGNEGCGIVETVSFRIRVAVFRVIIFSFTNFHIFQVGKGVTHLKTGDLVIAAQSGAGTWRTCGILKASQVISLDKSVPLHFAATLKVNPPTAYRMLKDFVPLKSGDTVLQNAGNSSVGRYVIQVWILETRHSHIRNVVDCANPGIQDDEHCTESGAYRRPEKRAKRIGSDGGVYGGRGVILLRIHLDYIDK